MIPLTIGDIRPFLDFAANSPFLDQNGAIAAQIRQIYTSFGQPITPELEQAFSAIENDPSLVGLGVEELRSAIDGLSDDTLLTDVPGLGTVDPVDPVDPVEPVDPVDPVDPVEPVDPVDPVDTTDPTAPFIDGNGNLFLDYTLPFSNVTISVADGVVSVATPDGTQQLNAVDRLTFDDGTLYFDVDEAPGSVYTAYEALFGVAPDKDGFDFWVDALESEAIDTYQLAESFVQTQAFADRYGSLVDDADALVSSFYETILGRTADQGGLDFWSDYIASADANALSDTLGYFLDSDELDAVNQASFADGLFV